MFGSAQQSGKRVPMIAGNWKMNETTVEAVTLAQQISFESDKGWEAIEVVICPPFTDLKSVLNVLVFDHSSIKLGAQDVFWEPDGAYTGAISTTMLKELECAYCIVGHSERRAYFGETTRRSTRRPRPCLRRESAPSCAAARASTCAMRAIRSLSSESRCARAGMGVDARGHRKVRYRLRAHLGNRDGPRCNARASARGMRAHPRRCR